MRVWPSIATYMSNLIGNQKGWNLRKLYKSYRSARLKRYISMKQATFTSVGFELVTNRTRKRELLDELNLVVPWTEFTGLIQPSEPASKTGLPPFPVATMLRIHFMHQWFTLRD